MAAPSAGPETPVGEVLVILLIAVLVFGTGKLRDVGSDLGAAVQNFRKAMNGVRESPPLADPAREDATFSKRRATTGRPGA